MNIYIIVKIECRIKKADHHLQINGYIIIIKTSFFLKSQLFF